MAAAKPTLAQIRYLVKLHAIQATGRTPVPADLPPMTEAEAAAPGSPLAYRCTDSAYGDKPGEPRDSRYLRDVMAHTISLDSCLELPAPPAWCVPTDARAFRKLRSKDVASDILATALHLDERIPRGWHQGHEYLRPKFDNVASLMQHVFTSAHFEGRKLLCSVRRSRGRVLRTQRCPLTDGKEPRRPDYPTSCVACDLELGNMEYVLLAHETLFLTDLAWDCGMSAPALAVTCIDGLALEADVAAGVLTQDDVHAVIGVLAAVAVRTGTPPPPECMYSCRSIDTGPGSDNDSPSNIGLLPSILAYAGMVQPTKRQADVLAKAQKVLSAAGRPASLASRMLVSSILHWSPGVLNDATVRSPPPTPVLAQTHSAASGMHIARLVHAFAVQSRKNVRLGRFSRDPTNASLKEEWQGFFQEICDKIAKVVRGDFMSAAELMRRQSRGEDISRHDRFTLRSPAELRALVSAFPDAAWVRDLGMGLGLPDPLPPAVEPPAVPRMADGLSEKQELVALCSEVAGTPGPSSPGSSAPPADVEAGTHAIAAIVRDDAIAQGCQTCGLGHGAAGPAAALMTCGRCRAVRYCSAACQRKHWATHKRVCQFLAPKDSEAAAAAAAATAAGAAGASPEASLSALASSISASLGRKSASAAPPSAAWLAEAQAAEAAFRKANRLD